MARGLSVFVNIGAKVGSSVGAAASATERRFSQMGQRIRVLGAEMKASLRGVEEAQSSRRNRVFEGIGAGYLGARMLEPFVNFEDALVRMGNTAEVHGSRLEQVGRQVQATGQRFGYAGTQAITGANDFVAAGMSMSSAMTALAPTLRLAKTAGVEVGEASQSGIALMQNLGVEARQLGSAFDIMAKAGKEGRFEINDMAREFPGLSSRAKLLGMSGLDGVRRMSAMLQITRTNARDAEEGANNLLNFLDKLTGNETLQHFDKLGVSVEAVLKKSKKNGTDFVDDMLTEIRRLTKDGTDAIALTKLFPDRQARQAALALITQRKELERIKGVLNGPGVGGTLEKDFGRIGKTSRFGLDRMWAGVERIGVALGRAFGPTLGMLAERFAGFTERFAAWAEKNPAIVRNIGLVTASLVGLRTVTNGLAWLVGGRLATAFTSLGKGLVGAAARGLLGLGSYMLTAGGPMLLTAFARIAPFAIRGILGVLSGPAGWALIAASVVTYFWPEISKYLPRFVELGNQFVGRIIDGIAAGWGRLVSWLAGKWNSLAPSALKIDVSPRVGPAVDPFARYRNVGPKKLPGRAVGGPVMAGKAYMVGEKGPEPFIPSSNGTIIPNHVFEARRAQRAGDTYNVTVHAPGGNGPSIAAEVERVLRRMAGGQSALLSD